MYFVCRRWHLHFVIALVSCRPKVVLGTVCLAQETSPYAMSSCERKSLDRVKGAVELRQIPESLLQLESHRRKPRNVTVAALSQGGELVSALELNASAWGANFTLLGEVPERVRIRSSEFA